MLVPRHILAREEFLSDIVKRELASYKKILKSKVSWGDRVSKCLYFIALLHFISLLVLVLLSKLEYDGGNATEAERLVSAVYAVGTIVAALTGMLIAIIAFSAQINSRYISGSDALFKQLISSTGYKPVAALAVGTVTGSLVGCVFDGSEPYWIVFSSVVVLVTFGVITVVAEVSVLFRAVDKFGRKAAITLFVQNFKKSHRESFLVEIKRRVTVNVFAGKLREIGFDWNIWEREAEG